MSTPGVDATALRDYFAIQTELCAGQCINRTTGRVIRAIVPVHMFGHPADINDLMSVNNEFNLALGEDAAESLHSYNHGQHSGTFGFRWEP